MNVFESRMGMDFVEMMLAEFPGIGKSLASIAKELERANEVAEGKVKLYEKMAENASLPFEYLIEFAKGIELGDMVGCKQLRSLWTSYCIVNDVDPDTSEYDTDLFFLWETIQPVWKGTSFDEFDNFMCEEMV